MRKSQLAITVFSMVLATSGCGDACREYSNYSCAQLERQTYNVLVYPPSDTEGSREYFAGEVVGLQACGAIAWDFAREHHFESSSRWSYICCLKTDESSCEEKHR